MNHWIRVRSHQIAKHNPFFHLQQDFLHKNGFFRHVFFEKKQRFFLKTKEEKTFTSLIKRLYRRKAAVL